MKQKKRYARNSKYKKNKSKINQEYNNWKLGLLSDHIIDNHHSYVKKVLPQINNLLEKNENFNNFSDDHLTEIKSHFKELTKEMMSHTEKEERIIFPIIKYLEDCKKFKEKPKTRGYGRIKDLIDVLESEHLSAVNIITDIKYRMKKYCEAKESSTKLVELYDNLLEFEQDLDEHVHLENNILFPKAINLENELLSKHN